MKHTNILSIGFLAGLSLLLLNDLCLKELFHNQLTGKLSDFAGLFIFPIFLGLIHPKRIWLNYSFTALFFVFWKSELSTAALTSINHLFHSHFSRVVDYTDFSALLILPFSYLYNRKPRLTVDAAILKPGIICVALFSFYATSAPDMNSEDDTRITGRYHRLWDDETYSKNVMTIGFQGKDCKSCYSIVLGPDVIDYNSNPDFIIAKINPLKNENDIDTTKIEYAILVVSKDTTELFGNKEVYEKLTKEQFLIKRKELGIPDSVILSGM